MRINQLDLTRYGKFTERSLRFDRKDGGRDLHVIYGPNEAGKSTLLSGWLDLLFGMPVQSKMGFLHPFKTMQLGAEVEIDGQVHSVLRVKKRNDSLLDNHSAPIGEALLHNGLHRLDRAAYAAMFSLNDQTLIEGGEDILASQGDLGKLLFSSSAGLSDLSDKLAGFRDEADAFLSTTGRKGHLLELKSAFDDLGRDLKELDTVASEYARLAKHRDTARADWQAARQEAEAATKHRLDLDRQIGALPLVDRLARLDSHIAAYGDLPVPPTGWADDLPALDRQQTETATRIETATQSVVTLTGEVASTEPDMAILALSDDIATAERAKSGYDTALEDLPRRTKERDGKSAEITASLKRLGQDGGDPAALLPEAGVLGSLRELIETRSGIEMALRNAAQELDEARETRTRRDRRLKDAGGTATDPLGLSGLVSRIRADDPVGVLERARATLAASQSRLQEALDDLHPWTGDAGALKSLHRPDDDGLETLRAELAAGEKSAERSAAESARLTGEMDRAEARLAPMGDTASVTLAQAAEVRALRETLWSEHKSALSGATADTFEQAMRLDDETREALSGQRLRAEKASDAQTALAEKQQELQAATVTATRAQTTLDNLHQKLAKTIASVSDTLDDNMGLSAFGKWLARLDTANECARTLKAADQDVTVSKATLERHQSDLLTALTQAGHTLDPATGLSVAVETAQSLLDREARAAALRDAVKDAEQDVERRTLSLTTAKDTDAAWQTRWAAACAQTWLGDTPPDVAAMRAILDELTTLQDSLGLHGDLDLRIRKMQGNRDHFEQLVATIATTLAMAAGGDTATDWCHITARLRTAEETATARGKLQTRLATAQTTLEDLQRNAELHQQKITEISGFFGVTTWAEARDALNDATARAERIKTRDEIAEDLCTRMNTPDAPQAMAQLQGLDSATLQAGADTLTTDMKTLTQEQEEAFDAFKSAERALNAVGGDGAVARLAEQRQTLLLEIEDGARDHLRKRLGLLAVDAALRRYRDTHRSGMLERASEAFRVMSQGRYSGLNAQPDGTREVLVAALAQGGSKEAAQLSDGTRAQLYLALRIAGYYEFVANNGPVPFIADDIMESFDNDRTTEALGLLAKMSETGQVIYLTHHAHVCEIAKSVCADVTVHELVV